MNATKHTLIALIVLALTGCATTGTPRVIDASQGQPSSQFTISTEGSAFIGAAPAVFLKDGTFIANVKRGETARIVLPCGQGVYAVRKKGAKEPASDTRSLRFDPCDGGAASLRISFEPFDGFYLTRQI